MIYSLWQALAGRKLKSVIKKKIHSWFKKKLEILAQLSQWLPEIVAGKISVFFLDECHLLWGDVCGYIWGKSNTRIEVPIVNERLTANLLRGIGLLQSRVFGSSLSSR